MFLSFIHVDTYSSSLSLLMLYATPLHEYTAIYLSILDIWVVSKICYHEYLLWKILSFDVHVSTIPLNIYLAGELLGHRNVS